MFILLNNQWDDFEKTVSFFNLQYFLLFFSFLLSNNLAYSLFIVLDFAVLYKRELIQIQLMH